MSGRRHPAKKADPLRQRAEEKARDEAAGGKPRSGRRSHQKSETLLHDLRVHQIELEMQNDELRRTQDAMGASRARYFDLYDLAPVGYLTLSELGLIKEANLTVAMLLGAARGSLMNKPVSRLIAREDEDIYYLRLKALFSTGESQVFELRLKHQDGH